MVDIIFYCIVVFLILLMLIIFIKNIKEIFVSFLQYLAFNSDYTFRVISIPIWFPFWIVDKIFKLNIFNVEFPDNRDDIQYKSEGELKFMMRDYTIFIITKLKIDEIKDIIKDFFSLADRSFYKFWFNYSGNSTVVKIQSNDLNEFLELLQRFNEEARTKSSAAFLNVNKNKFSFVLEQDLSPKHINSFLGYSSNNITFTVNALDDFSKEQYLSINSKINIEKSFDFPSFSMMIEKISFEQLKI